MLRIDVVTLPINFCISSMSSSYYNFLVLSVCHLVDYSRAIFNLEKIVEKDWKYSISESLPADLIFFLLYFYLNDSERNLFCAFVIKQSYKGSIVNRTSLSIKQKSWIDVYSFIQLFWLKIYFCVSQNKYFQKSLLSNVIFSLTFESGVHGLYN